MSSAPHLMSSPQGVFLTAEWKYVAMLNWAVRPDVLRPYVPRCTELDSHAGRAFLSLVGFRFLNTRVLGVPIPWHRNFDEVNLRIYVLREENGEPRRGVSFIREIVPRRAIAFIARLAYHEPYMALPMRSEVPAWSVPSPGRVRYAWRSGSGWHHLEATAVSEAREPLPGSEEEFISRHHWGYTRQRDGGTLEYHVEHPNWRVWQVIGPEVGGDMRSLYGSQLGEALSRPPQSAFLAEGSDVVVSRPRRLP